MLGEVDRKIVHEELRLVVVDVLDVDREVEVALQRRRDAQVERLYPQQVDLLPLPGRGKTIPQSSLAHIWTHKRQLLGDCYLKSKWIRVPNGHGHRFVTGHIFQTI